MTQGTLQRLAIAVALVVSHAPAASAQLAPGDLFPTAATIMQRYAPPNPQAGVATNLYSYAGGNPINRFDPSGLSWEFSQRTGQWTHIDDATGNRTVVGNGYSGTGAGRNNPAMEAVPNVGPTPRGDYNIGDARNSPNTGRMTLAITPRPGTDTHGRTLLRIHGDNADHDASEGCAIAPYNVRRMINDSDDRVLHVVN